MTTWDLTEAKVTTYLRATYSNRVKVSEEVTATKTVAYYDVKDAEDLKANPWGSIVVRPDVAIVSFQDGRYYGVEVIGQRVLKSGGTGVTRHQYWPPYQRSDWPDWLVKLVKEAEEDIK